MHKEQVVGIAVRLFAIFLGLYTLRHVSGLLPYAAAPSPNNISFVFLFLFAFFPILAAILLWLFPLAVATKIIPNIKAKNATAPLDANGMKTGTDLIYWKINLSRFFACSNKREVGGQIIMSTLNVVIERDAPKAARPSTLR